MITKQLCRLWVFRFVLSLCHAYQYGIVLRDAMYVLQQTEIVLSQDPAAEKNAGQVAFFMFKNQKLMYIWTSDTEMSMGK